MTEKFKVLNDYTLQVSVDMSPKPHRPESYELTETAALHRSPPLCNNPPISRATIPAKAVPA
jgi:hypothetical protein